MPLAFNRTIESPGVEIRELDYTLNVGLPVGTNILTMGFASQGPTYELLNITSISEFELVYGKPTNAAERYFYHTSKQVLTKNGNLIATRLPYGSGSGEGFGAEYSALVYPVVGALSGTTRTGFESASAYYILSPTQIKLTESQFKNIESGGIAWENNETGAEVNWSYDNLGKAGFIILNKSKYTTNELREGYYVAIADNTKVGFGTDYDCLRSFKTVTTNSSATKFQDTNSNVVSSVLNFELTGSYEASTGTTSEIIESIPSYEFSDSSFNDSLIFAIIKLRTSMFASDARTVSLDQVLTNAFIGSLDSRRTIQSQTGGDPESFFIEKIMNDQSPDFKILVNPFISTDYERNWTENGEMKKKVRIYSAARSGSVVAVPSNTTEKTMITNYINGDTSDSRYADSGFAIGPYVPRTFASTKIIGTVNDKIERALRLAENNDEVPLDIVVEGGLGTVSTWTAMASALKDQSIADAISGVYDNWNGDYRDDWYLPGVQLSAAGLNRPGNVPAGLLIAQEYSSESGGSDANNTGRNSWAANLYQVVYNKFNTFCEYTRRPGSLFIADPLRHTLVQGELPVIDCVSPSGVKFNFPQHIYWGLRNLFAESNSSYSCTYANWVKSYDSNSDRIVWLPFSGFAAGIMANVDRNAFPWFAPAGLNRGIVNDVVQLAINPTQKQRDLLYRHGLNPVCYFPQDGYAVWGQKTLYKKPSAFDRINVRRLFLVLEKASVAVSRYFVFEPNTVFTRARVIDTLRPIFERAKNNEGLYDYLIICDERNNTPDVIDRNELVVDIYLKPVRAAEFILLSFIATRTGQDFSELI